MHTLNISLDDAIYQTVLDFLNTLPKNSVHIHQYDTTKIDLSKFQTKTLQQIKDPVQWQQTQRDEW